METRCGTVRVRASRVFLLVAALSLLLSANLAAQRPGDAEGAGPRTARAAAPDDLTGYWVSIVTEMWRYRMLVPDKGDYVKVPLNPEGRKVADAWDPAKDQASGNECKSYGAAAILHVPGRLHIYWQDDNTLRMDTDYLKVVTTHMRPGYLQKNGVPYSGNAILEEYFDRFSDPYTRNTWLSVTTVVTDPQYLIEPLITHAHFKKIPDSSGWDPTPCRANEPR